MFELLFWIFAVIPTEEPTIPGNAGTFIQNKVKISLLLLYILHNIIIFVSFFLINIVLVSLHIPFVLPLLP